MHFSMDEIGFENILKIKTLTTFSEKWKFLYNVAKGYGFEGIHITPSLYNGFDLDISTIPDYFQVFKLTYHLGGIYSISTKDDYIKIDNDIEKSFIFAEKHNFLDISIHPPNIHRLTHEDKLKNLDFFHKIIYKWVRKVLIMVSLYHQKPM